MNYFLKSLGKIKNLISNKYVRAKLHTYIYQTGPGKHVTLYTQKFLA